MISIFHQLDFLHSALARVNQPEASDDIGRGTMALCMLFAPPLLVVSLNYYPLSKSQAILFLAPLSFLMAYLYAHLRKVQLSKVRASIPFPTPPRVQFTAFSYCLFRVSAASLPQDRRPLRDFFLLCLRLWFRGLVSPNLGMRSNNSFKPRPLRGSAAW